MGPGSRAPTSCLQLQTQLSYSAYTEWRVRLQLCCYITSFFTGSLEVSQSTYFRWLFICSTLQALIHAPLMRNYFLGDGHNPAHCEVDEGKPCLGCEMVGLLCPCPCF